MQLEELLLNTRFRQEESLLVPRSADLPDVKYNWTEELVFTNQEAPRKVGQGKLLLWLCRRYPALVKRPRWGLDCDEVALILVQRTTNTLSVMLPPAEDVRRIMEDARQTFFGVSSNAAKFTSNPTAELEWFHLVPISPDGEERNYRILKAAVDMAKAHRTAVFSAQPGSDAAQLFCLPLGNPVANEALRSALASAGSEPDYVKPLYQLAFARVLVYAQLYSEAEALLEPLVRDSDFRPYAFGLRLQNNEVPNQIRSPEDRAAVLREWEPVLNDIVQESHYNRFRLAFIIAQVAIAYAYVDLSLALRLVTYSLAISSSPAETMIAITTLIGLVATQSTELIPMPILDELTEALIAGRPVYWRECKRTLRPARIQSDPIQSDALWASLKRLQILFPQLSQSSSIQQVNSRPLTFSFWPSPHRPHNIKNPGSS